MYYVTEYIAKLLGLGHRGRAALRGENGRSPRKALPELGGGRCGAGLRFRRAARTSLLQVRLVFTIFFQTRFTSLAAGVERIIDIQTVFRGVVGCCAWAAALVVLWERAGGPDGV